MSTGQAMITMAISVFSPDGRLFQVEYAYEAVRAGACVVGVLGKDVGILGVERKTMLHLQDPRSVFKVVMLDNHICAGYAGVTADGLVLVDKARTECQRHRLTVEDPVTVEYIARHIAGIKQQYTQSDGVRPFGVSILIVGFDPHDTRPTLYQTDPSGSYSAWKATAIGRSSQRVFQFLDKNYKDDMTREECIKLTIEALLGVVETTKNIEICVIESYGKASTLEQSEIKAMANEIERERKPSEWARLAATSDEQAAIAGREGARVDQPLE